MITIISATNRKSSHTLKVAEEYSRLLTEKKVEHLLFSLEQLPLGILHSAMYDIDDAGFVQLQKEYFFDADKFIFIMPEYNGSVPGVLKILIDVSDIRRCFYGKKALLVGVATGKAGNLRGMDHLTAILNHLKMHVHWNHLPISKIDEELDAKNHFHNAVTLKIINKQIDEFLAY